jgi:hypothetical protein
MSTGPGNDPFSGSETQNILQRMISPKIVTDGATGYVVKSDLINIDNVYLTGNVYSNGSQLGGSPYVSVKSSAQGSEIAIGDGAGQTTQSNQSVAIGGNAGQTTQGVQSVAIGYSAGNTSQAQGAIAIGYAAGNLNQGICSVAVGYGAGNTNQAATSIVINATGTVVQNTTASSCVIKPIRGDTKSLLETVGFKQLYYNPTTGELCYDTS